MARTSNPVPQVLGKDAKPIGITTDWGIENFWICPVCCALVRCIADHAAWHQRLEGGPVSQTQTQMDSL